MTPICAPPTSSATGPRRRSAITALGVLIPLLRNGWRLYGPAPEFEVVERELEARRQKNQIRGELRSGARDRAARRSRRHGGRFD
jgi:hypothetical protein